VSRALQEAVIYGIVALSALFVMAYSVHMVVGDLVSVETEYAIMGAVCLIGAAAMGFMAWDVLRRRRSGGNN
jgi:hypothetical protein